MYSEIKTATLSGIHGEIVTVETDLLPGLPGLILVGLADQSVKESRERVKSAMLNSGYGFPGKKIVVNLSPADRKKDGSHFDLPVAVGILCACGRLDQRITGQYAMVGELSLNGQIRGITGALPLVLALRGCGIKKVIVPEENRSELEIIHDMELYEAGHLNQVVSHLQGISRLNCINGENMYNERQTDLHMNGSKGGNRDFSQVVGQETAKRCVILACGGMHGLLMCGAPGVGKTMIASRIPTVLPTLSYSEMLEVTQIYSAAGLMHLRGNDLHIPPFRSPHYETSAAAMIGGGMEPAPGEVTLAHNGVLFLDELPLFKPHVLDSLRTPMEDGVIRVSRRGGKYEYPSRFMLVGAANPCRCGYYGDPHRECTCTRSQLESYRHRMSGPLLDRMDLQIHLSAPALSERMDETTGKQTEGLTSAQMREQIEAIRKIQRLRYEKESISYNSQLTPGLIDKYCVMDNEARTQFSRYIDRFRISIRAQHRILKTARTVADGEDCEMILWPHLAEALQYRSGWRAGERV
ncbi:MAG: YifB family Mg chelatase-like AAA ATPase [Firmicutes bacterium]|nr:YifB family Mg chelatase-like AAA ATPase [Bacillota bacterium]